MKRVFLLAFLLLPTWIEGSARAQATSVQSLSIKDLGLGMPKKPETPFEPGWAVEAGAVILQRSGSSSVVLAETNTPEVGDILDAADLGFRFDTGPYVSISKQLFGSVWGEIVYFGVYDWGAERSAENPAAITTGVFDPGEAVFDRIDVRYTSQVNNVEVNTRFPLLGQLDWLVGFRWTGLEEHSSTTWDGGDDLASATAWGKNQLYGAQAGVDGTLWRPSSRLYLDGMAKACVFTNQMSTGRDIDGTFENFLPNRRSVTRTSFLGELGIMGRFELTRHFILGAGYQVMWVDGVASGFSALGGQDVSSVLFHGFRATIVAKW